MKLQPLRVGIAGLGFGAQVYLPVIQHLEEARLCALADGGSNKAADLAFSLDGPVRSFADGKAMIKQEKLDCVIISTPPVAQSKLVRLAMENGIPVLCEKPCGTTLQECAELATLTQKTDICAATSFEYRYEAGIAGLIDLVGKGEIGVVREISVQWRTKGGLNPDRLWSWRDDTAQGGGILNEFCTHVFDYLSLLADAPVDRILCNARTVVTERPGKNGKTKRVTAPDNVEIECISENGVLARLSVSNASPKRSGHHIAVRGDLGSARFDHMAPFALGTASLTIVNSKGRVTRRLPAAGSFDCLDSRCAAVADMVRDFLSTIRGKTRPRLAKIKDCLIARQCVSAAELSAASGEWFPRINPSLHEYMQN